MIKKHPLKVTIRLELDLEVFTVPADGDIKTQLKDDLEQLLYDYDGVTVKDIVVTGKELQGFME